MDPNSQNYWQPQQPQQAAPAQSQLQPQATVALEPPQQPSTPPSAYNGYDLTTPAAVGSAAVFSAATQPQHNDEAVSWEASEYVHHQKGVLWFAAFGLIFAALLAVAIWLQAWTFVVLVVIMAIAAGVYALRTPRAVHYLLDDQGIKIGERGYQYSDFRAFGVASEGSLFSVILLPTKRFMPAITVYFEEADGERIVDILGSRLPMEEVDHDPVDRLMRRLRF
jgi:hypothetical protein